MTTSPAHPMNFVSIRLITDDTTRLAAFYEHVTTGRFKWSTPDFGELHTPVATLAIGSTRTLALMAPGSARPADNHSAIIEFLVENVDAEYQRLTALGDPFSPEFVSEATTMPWGNRSLLLRDPDGNLVNLFTPVTPDAMAKFGQ